MEQPIREHNTADTLDVSPIEEQRADESLNLRSSIASSSASPASSPPPSPLPVQSLLSPSSTSTLRPSTSPPTSQPPPQKLQQRSRGKTTVKFAASGWWWEVGALVVALTCVSLTVAILSYMDGRFLSAWKLPIQPNSLIAVFSSVGKSALLVPIAECIGQLRWMYLDAEKSRELSQLQTFDDASRGPWGALVWLWEMRSVKPPPVLTMIGAAVTILLLAFEPFAQQAIEYPTRKAAMLNETRSVYAARGLPWIDGDSSGYSPLSFRLGMSHLISNRSDMFIKQAQCATDDCRLPDYITLATCVECDSDEYGWDHLQDQHCRYDISIRHQNGGTDIFTNISHTEFAQHVEAYKTDTPMITTGRGIVSYDVRCSVEYKKPGYLPAYLQFSGYLDERHESSTRLLETSQYFLFGDNNFTTYDNSTIPDKKQRRFWAETCTGLNGSRNSIDNGTNYSSLGNSEIAILNLTCVAMLSDPQDLWMPDQLMKNLKDTLGGCSLSLCPRIYGNVTVVNDRLQFTKISLVPLVQNTSVGAEGDHYMLQPLDDEHRQIMSQTFPRDNETHYNTESYDPLRSNWTNLFDVWTGRDDLINVTTQQIKDIYDDYRTARGSDSTWTEFLLAAASVTDSFMQSNGTYLANAVTGPAYTLETYVRVRWVWYTLPLILNLTTALLLLFTARQSARKPYLFKSSLLAVLFHGLDGADGNGISENEGEKSRLSRRQTGSELKERAEKHKVKLGRNANGELKILKVD